MHTLPVSHFLHFEQFENDQLGKFFDSCAADGAECLSLTPPELERLAAEPLRIRLLQTESARTGIRFLNAHAPYGEAWDLNCPDSVRRPELLAGQKRFFEICASLGVETVTLHIGTNDSGRPADELRNRARESLAELLPAAEARGLVLAIENTLFPTDTPDELLGFLAACRSPSLGICFDAGHANLMDGTPGKHSDRMVEWIRRRWRGNVRFETDTLASLLPHIVTCHLHDNHGFDDEHLLAGDGTIDWPALFGRLAGAPRLRSLQNEANMAACRIAPRRAVERFRALGRREARLHA